MKLSGIRQEGNGVEWGAPVVPIGVEKGVVVRGNPELDVPVVVVVVPADVVVVALTSGPADPAGSEGDKTLAVVPVVGEPAVVIGDDMVLWFCILTSKFSSDYFHERD